VSTPPQVIGALVQVTLVAIASWALNGFYLSLKPALVRVATGTLRLLNPGSSREAPVGCRPEKCERRCNQNRVA
jgi:hypothetical protein